MVHLPSEDLSPLAALAAALRGEPRALTGELIGLAKAHRVDALLTRTAAHEAMAAAQDRELIRVLGHLAAAGVRPILIKGAHLGHTIYPSAALRPRRDTDLVIAAEEQQLLASLLEDAGYRRAVHVRGTLILGQCHFHRTDDLGVIHALDVHWRVAAPLVVRHVLPAAVLRASRVAIPALGPNAWGPSRPHALLIACLHLVAHHQAGPILLWLHDIARLVDGLDDDDATLFLDTAEASGILTVCVAALDRARRYFDGPALASLADRARARSAGLVEPSKRLVTARRPISYVWLDLRSAEGWRERITLLREHLLPDPEYIRATQAGGRWLSLAYTRRVLFGAWKWIRPAVVDR